MRKMNSIAHRWLGLGCVSKECNRNLNFVHSTLGPLCSLPWKSLNKDEVLGPPEKGHACWALSPEVTCLSGSGHHSPGALSDQWPTMVSVVTVSDCDLQERNRGRLVPKQRSTWAKIMPEKAVIQFKNSAICEHVLCARTTARSYFWHDFCPWESHSLEGEVIRRQCDKCSMRRVLWSPW